MGNFLLTVLMDDKESAKIILALYEPTEIKKSREKCPKLQPRTMGKPLFGCCGKRKYGKGILKELVLNGLFVSSRMYKI